MYSAKAARRGVELYAADRDHYSPRRLSLSADLRHDLEAGRLQVYFQPKADTRTARVTGFEALLRWTHPTYGPIPPDEFVPIAEQSGLIAPLTRWVLSEALSHLARWRASGLDVTVAVNLSARSLLDINLVEDVRRCLRNAGVPGRALVLELTETSVMADPNRSGEVLGELTALGCHVAIDDFGTGYSSLSRLKQLPVDEVKIDKSFVLHMATDADDATIVRSIIDLARNLGLTAVAEGVEDAESWRTLDALGCGQIQGYYFSRPLPPAELDVWLGQQVVDHVPVLMDKWATAV
jgi:EAL domain-containing protein (putative c-di-GMP-specific phosphodiesterase class I)